MTLIGNNLIVLKRWRIRVRERAWLALLLLRERSPGGSPAALGFGKLDGKQANGKIHGQALRTGKNERTKS